MDYLIFKKMVTPFLIPPGIFVVLILGGAIVSLRRGRSKMALFGLMTGALLWFSAAGPVSDTLLARLERGLVIPAHPSGDVIILLGGGIYEDAKDLSGKGIPGEEMMYRLVTAVRLQKRLHLPVVVSGGAVLPGKPAEAPVVKRFLTDLGVPADEVIIEDRSRDTSENARYCRELCAIHGFRKPLLITSGYHMPRSLMAFEKVGLKVAPVPAAIRTAFLHRYVAIDYLPSAGALGVTATVLREYLGILFYRFGGR